MKWIATVLIVTCLVFAAGAANAQETAYLRIPHHITIFLDGGIGVPATPQPFKTAWNTTLPFELGIGYAVFAWMDVNLVYSYAGFGNNSLESKRQIGYAGTQVVSGGDITTQRFFVNTRFLAVPNQRANPFVEVGIGQFKTSATNLEVEGVFVNSMPDTKGTTVSAGFGIQYALNEQWSAYTKFDWNFNLDSSFAPNDLLIDPTSGQTPSGDGDGNQEYAAVLVGLLIRL